MKAILVLFCAFVAVIAQPDVIQIAVPNLQPEGIEFTSATNFLVSSLSVGTVFKVSDNGVATPFVSNNALVNSVGLHLDATNNRLYIANIDFAGAFGNLPGFQAGLVIAEADTGNFLSAIDLTSIGPVGKARFANDVVPDKNSNVYVTDSLGSQIWKVDASGNATIFCSNAAWDALPNSSGIGLNGIEIDPETGAFLLAGQSGVPGKLWKIPFNGAAAGTPIEVKTDIAVNGIDGITFGANGNLFVVNNPQQIVYELQSTDKWNSATVIAQGSSKFPTPTTLTFANGAPFVVHAYFANVTQYQIEKITLTAVPNDAAGTFIFNFGLIVLAFIAIFA